MTNTYNNDVGNLRFSNSRPVQSGTALGYNSAREGTRFNQKFIDNNNHAVAVNYERGRLIVLEAKATGMKVPPLTPTGAMPKKMINYLEVCRVIGDVPTVPRTSRKPDDETLAFPSSLDRRGFPKPIPTYS